MNQLAKALRILDYAEELIIKPAVLDRREAAWSSAGRDQQAVETERAAVRGGHGPPVSVATGYGRAGFEPNPQLVVPVTGLLDIGQGRIRRVKHLLRELRPLIGPVQV